MTVWISELIDRDGRSDQEIQELEGKVHYIFY